MIVTISIRIITSLTYDILLLYDYVVDSLVLVTIINLTEIVLVIIITQSLKWSLLTYAHY